MYAIRAVSSTGYIVFIDVSDTLARQEQHAGRFMSLCFVSLIVVVHHETRTRTTVMKSSLHSETEISCSKHEGHGAALSPL